MSKEKSYSVIDVGFFGLLTIAFIVLKLCNVIDWGWIWVLSPLWIPTAVIISLVGIGLIWAYWSANSKANRFIKKFKEENHIPPAKSRFQQRMDEYLKNKQKA